MDSLRNELNFSATSKFEKFGNKLKLILENEEHKMDRNHTPATRLHNYQIDAVLQTVKWLDEGKEKEKMGLIVAPPGSGKSGIVTLLPYAMRSSKVLILTPSKIISTQLAQAFGYPNLRTAFFLKCGILTELRQLNAFLETPLMCNKTEDIRVMGSHNLVIINAQKFSGNAFGSLSRRPLPVKFYDAPNRNHLSMIVNLEHKSRKKMLTIEQLGMFDTILVDEAHHYPAKTWANIIHYFQGKKIIFLTATPFRGSIEREKKMTQFSRIKTIIEISRKQLEGSTIRKCEFIEKYNSQKTFSSEFFTVLRNDILAIFTKHRQQENRFKNPQAMVLVTTVKEALEVAVGLGPSIATYVASGKSSDKNLDDFTQGKFRIVVVCGMLKEGYDNPNVTLVVILRNCRSRVLFEQFAGRCIRMNRELTGSTPDRVIATILSYTHFHQKQMWVASCLPVEDEKRSVSCCKFSSIAKYGENKIQGKSLSTLFNHQSVSTSTMRNFNSTITASGSGSRLPVPIAKNEIPAESCNKTAPQKTSCDTDETSTDTDTDNSSDADGDDNSDSDSTGDTSTDVDADSSSDADDDINNDSDTPNNSSITESDTD